MSTHLLGTNLNNHQRVFIPTELQCKAFECQQCIEGKLLRVARSKPVASDLRTVVAVAPPKSIEKKPQ